MASPFLRVSRTLTGPLRSSIRPRSTAAPRRPNNRTRASSSASPSASPSTSSFASSSTSSSSDAAQPAASLVPILYTTAGILLLGGTYLYATDTRAAIHRWLVPPLLRLCFPDAEDAHDFGTATLKALYSLSLHPRERNLFPSSSSSGGDVPLSVTVFGTELANPLGISAGLDKHADIPDALFDLGAAVVEVGGCTALPQAGNARPRVFRLPSLDGMINRYGLNSRGADVMAIQLRERVRKFALSRGLSLEAVLDGKAGVPPGSLRPGKLLAVQVAKNKDTDERDVVAVARDYVYCVRRLAPYADVLVVNVSSPNTPGLRDLQAVEPLSRILAAVVKEAQRTPRASKPKVMVKVSPDEDEDAQMEGIVQAVWMSGVDGVIVGNTTKRRTGVVPEGIKLTAREANTLQETGGFSGPMMFDRTLGLVGRYRKMLDGVYAKAEEEAAAHKVESPEQKVVFATGGITNGEQALKILNAGASLAMVYTALVYGGAGTITRMKSEMREKLVEEKKK